MSPNNYPFLGLINMHASNKGTCLHHEGVRSWRVPLFNMKECTQGGCTSLAQRSALKLSACLHQLGVCFCFFECFSLFSLLFHDFECFSSVCMAKRKVSKSRNIMSSLNHGLTNSSTSNG